MVWLHKSPRKNFPRRHVIQKGINDTWQDDLVEMIPYANNNFNKQSNITRQVTENINVVVCDDITTKIVIEVKQ